jgi:hypothetical protein
LDFWIFGFLDFWALKLIFSVQQEWPPLMGFKNENWPYNLRNKSDYETC